MFKRLMLVIVMLFFSCSILSATEIGFTWDPNSEVDLKGYRLYQTKASGVYIKGEDKAVATIPVGTEIASIHVEKEGLYYWVLTAFDKYGNESDFSNEVKHYFNFSPPAIPVGFKVNITVVVTGE